MFGCSDVCLGSVGGGSGRKTRFQHVKEAFQLEIEKLSAYTVVSQLREYIPGVQWVGGLRR